MTDLLVKLNYKGQERIAVINAEDNFIQQVSGKLENVIIDKRVDPRYPYSFMILFVTKSTEVDHITTVALHNLTADGILWFCYPKKSSKKNNAGLDRDHGWKALEDAGFRGIRLVSIDDDWSALRFRNVRYIKTTGDRNK
ncbi:MAG: hypothetical protein ACM3UT_10660 [Chloroflexota bacterium]